MDHRGTVKELYNYSAKPLNLTLGYDKINVYWRIFSLIFVTGYNETDG